MDKILAQAADGKRQDGAGESAAGEQKPLPKGVVIGKDGKPCRTCTSVRDWMSMTKASSKASSSSASASAASAAAVGGAAAASTSTDLYPSDCPPDVEKLGNHTWTLLHSISASYPSKASQQQQSDMKQFLDLFGRLYPCWVCAEDFQDWMSKKENEPKVEGRNELGQWMCEAHNEVNRKLGKETFDCSKWQQRWRDGWSDGRCG